MVRLSLRTKQPNKMEQLHTSGRGVLLGPLGLGLSNQTITVLDLDLLSAVVLHGGEGVVVDKAICEATNQGGPAGNL